MVKFYIKAVSISGPVIIVDYEIVLINGIFEGAIGGGRTEIPVAALEVAIDNLKIALESHIEQTVGISPIAKTSQPQEEEDPL